MEKMMTKEQIDYFGKEAAKTYLEEGIDLNRTITKIAEEHALNHYEIDRVVEAANTNTYLSMFSTLDDKYIEFPVADSEKVAEYLHPTAEIDDFSDYDQPPKKYIEEISIFPVEGAEKTSSVQDENPFSADSLRFRQRTKYAEQQLKEKISLAETSFSQETENLYQMVKQAVLSGNRFGHIKVAMEQHSPGKFIEYFTKVTEERLKNEDRRLDLSVPTEKLGTVNKDNELLKQLNKIADVYEEVLDANIKLASLMTETMGHGIAKTKDFLVDRAKNLTRFVGKHPGYSLAGGATLTAGGMFLAHQSGKKETELELSAIRSIPDKYKKR